MDIPFPFLEQNSDWSHYKQFARGMKKFFGLTTQKENCCVCSKRVYINEKLSYDSKIFHPECFRCKKCNCKITTSSVGKYGEDYYCYTHMMEEFKSKGSFRQLVPLKKVNSSGVELMSVPSDNAIPKEGSLEKPKEDSKRLSSESKRGSTNDTPIVPAYPEWLRPDLLENGFRYIVDKDLTGKITVQKKALKDIDMDEHSDGVSLPSLSRPESPVEDVPKKKKFGFTFAKKKDDRKKSAGVLEDVNLHGTPPSGGIFRKSMPDTRRMSTPRVKKYFGTEYEQQMEKETTTCPKIIIEFVDFLIEEKAYLLEGIFRISGVQTDMESLQSLIESEKEYSLKAIKDTHVISSLLKLYFRSLPSPFFSPALYSRIILLPTIQSDEDRVVEIKSCIEELSVYKKYCFGILLNLLSLVLQNTKINMMDSSNIATVFGINLLKDNTEDPIQFVTTQQKITKAFRQFLDHYPQYSDVFQEKKANPTILIHETPEVIDVTVVEVQELGAEEKVVDVTPVEITMPTLEPVPVPIEEIPQELTVLESKVEMNDQLIHAIESVVQEPILEGEMEVNVVVTEEVDSKVEVVYEQIHENVPVLEIHEIFEEQNVESKVEMNEEHQEDHIRHESHPVLEIQELIVEPSSVDSEADVGHQINVEVNDQHIDELIHESVHVLEIQETTIDAILVISEVQNVEDSKVEMNDEHVHHSDPVVDNQELTIEAMEMIPENINVTETGAETVQVENDQEHILESVPQEDVAVCIDTHEVHHEDHHEDQETKMEDPLLETQFNREETPQVEDEQHEVRHEVPQEDHREDQEVKMEDPLLESQEATSQVEDQHQETTESIENVVVEVTVEHHIPEESLAEPIIQEVAESPPESPSVQALPVKELSAHDLRELDLLISNE
jgi:hypothetical protein